jgi:transposase
MKQEEFDITIKSIEDGGMPETCGTTITREQFYIIVEYASKNIYNWGWHNFVKYIEEKWKVRLVPKLQENE